MSDELQTKLHMLALQGSLPAKGYRYIFETKPKPWYWLFTWWLKKWKNYGDFIPIDPKDPRYETAPYEMGILYSETVAVNPNIKLPIVFQRDKEQ